MLPSLREERAQTYSPFLPIRPRPASCCRCRSCRMTPRRHHHARRSRHRRTFDDARHRRRCKLQWKPDWAMRWVALGIDYEMAGKDLIEFGEALRRNLPRARWHAAGRFQLRTLPRREGPEDFQVEGQRPDHRRMAALCVPGSLLRCSCIASRSRRSGSTSTSSRAMSTTISSSSTATSGRIRKQRLSNPVWHIHSGNPPKPDMPITFQMLLTLVSSSNAENAETLVGLHRALSAGRDAADASEARRAGRLRDQLLSRLRGADEKIPRADRKRTQGADRSARRAVEARRRMRRRKTFRMSSMKSAVASRFSITRRRARTASPACRSTGSTCSIRCCSGRRKARASARSSRPMASPTRVEMIDGALARSA